VSQLKTPLPAMLIYSLMARHESIIEEVLGLLQARYGRIALKSGILPFSHTDYYQEEFGPGLIRLFVGLDELVPQDILVQAKLFAVELERRFSLSEKRLINIDPGLLTLERLVLATGKNFTHRIYLGQGVFADLTLIFQGGSYQPLAWTFPDYRERSSIEMWNTWRSIYKKMLNRVQ